jgi:hypothetical protein
MPKSVAGLYGSRPLFFASRTQLGATFTHAHPT